MTTIVNIGRNLRPGTKHARTLTDLQWADFVSDVHTMLAAHGGRDIHVFRAIAHYKSEPEESASIQVFDDDDLNLHNVRASLHHFAQKYAQDSIALTTAPTEFLG